jgi:2-polyprenyl-6-methoxyphenol hydroxylase-like FAD-dependent oxidoreductase
MRSWLEQRLANQLGPHLIQYNSTVESIHFLDNFDGPIRVNVRNNVAIRCSAVVAADGPRSPIRRQLLPNADHYFVGYGVISAPAVPQKGLLVLENRACTWLPRTPELLLTVPQPGEMLKW